MEQQNYDLKQNIKQLKLELVQRENIADALKRQIRDLRQTINLQASGKDLSMYENSQNQSVNFDSSFKKNRSVQRTSNVLSRGPASAKPKQQARKNNTSTEL